MSLGGALLPNFDIYRLIINKVIIPNSKQQCTITDANNTGVVDVGSIKYQFFTWKGNYGKVAGLRNIYGGSYVVWDQLKSSKCNISADKIIIHRVR